MNSFSEGAQNDQATYISDSSLPDLRVLINQSPLAAEIFMLFIEYMDENSKALVVSQQAIMNLTGKSKVSVAKAIKTLEDNEWIRVIKLGSENAYVVTRGIMLGENSNVDAGSPFAATVVPDRNTMSERSEGQ